MTPFTTTLLTAASTGLLGGLHCVAMCGPLAAAGCTRPRDGRVALGATGGYLFGRLISYATVGAIVGAVGQHAVHILPVTTVQTIAVLSVAGLAAVRGVTLLWPRSGELVQLRAGDAGLFSATIRFGASLLPRRGLGLGLATGVLPCGMLLVGWALAAGTADPLRGAAVMGLFAIATAPGLVLPVVGTRLLQRYVSRLPGYAHGLLWCALAVMVGLRPLWGMAAHGGH